VFQINKNVIAQVISGSLFHGYTPHRTKFQLGSNFQLSKVFITLQGHRKEKITSTANVGPVQLEFEVIMTGRLVGPLGPPHVGDAPPVNFWDFKYSEVPSGVF
jgi:hypothetical protein